MVTLVIEFGANTRIVADGFNLHFKRDGFYTIDLFKDGCSLACHMTGALRFRAS